MLILLLFNFETDSNPLLQFVNLNSPYNMLKSAALEETLNSYGLARSAHSLHESLLEDLIVRLLKDPYKVGPCHVANNSSFLLVGPHVEEGDDFGALSFLPGDDFDPGAVALHHLLVAADFVDDAQEHLELQVRDAEFNGFEGDTALVLGRVNALPSDVPLQKPLHRDRQDVGEASAAPHARAVEDVGLVLPVVVHRDHLVRYLRVVFAAQKKTLLRIEVYLQGVDRQPIVYVVLLRFLSVEKLGVLSLVHIDYLYLVDPEPETVPFNFVLEPQVDRLDADVDIVEQLLEECRDASIIFAGLSFLLGLVLLVDDLADVVPDGRFLKMQQHRIGVVLLLDREQGIDLVDADRHYPLVAGPVYVQLYLLHVAVPQIVRHVRVYEYALPQADVTDHEAALQDFRLDVFARDPIEPLVQVLRQHGLQD